MAFYSSHPPIQLYAYAPMAIPNQPEFYAVYPGGGQPVVDASTFYYEANPKGMMSQSGQCHLITQSTVRCHVTRGGRFRPHGAGSSETFCLEFHFSFTLCSERQSEGGSPGSGQVSYLTSSVSHMTPVSLSLLCHVCHVIS